MEALLMANINTPGNETWPIYRVVAGPVSERLVPDIVDPIAADFLAHEWLALKNMAHQSLGGWLFTDANLVLMVAATSQINEAEAIREVTMLLEKHLPSALESVQSQVFDFGSEVVGQTVSDAATLAKESADAVIKAAPGIGFSLAAIVAAIAAFILITRLT